MRLALWVISLLMIAAVSAIASAHPGGISWHWFVDGWGWLRADGLGVYAAHPDLQIGPLALLLVGAVTTLLGASLGQSVTLVLLEVGLVVVLLALSPRRDANRATWIASWVAGALLALSWPILVHRWSHVDDALALVLIAAAVGLLRPNLAGLAGLDPSHPDHRPASPLLPASWRDRAIPIGALLALASAAKPWAVVAVPLLLVLPRATRWRAALVALVLGLLCWGPFVLGAAGTTAALAPPVKISDTSLLWWLGIHDVVPGWVRPAQLAGGLALALLVVWRQRPASALLAGLGLRFLIDPQHLAYYAAGAVLVAMLADVLPWDCGPQRRWPMPWRTIMTAAVFWQPFVADFSTRLSTTTGLAHWWFAHPSVVATATTAWAVVMILDALLWAPMRVPPGSAAATD